MLVDRDFSIRVADFGMSRQRRKAMLSAKSQGGTAEWTAPEVLRGLPYHEKADVFSFGVVLHELMTQTAPWNELSTIQVCGAQLYDSQEECTQRCDCKRARTVSRLVACSLVV